MARFEVKGLEEYASVITKLASGSEEMLKKAVYPGAGYMAERMAAAISSIPTETRRYGTKENPLNGLMDFQKWDLYKGLGIAKFENKGGYVNVKVGFDGYGRSGIPNILLARAVTSGTSFRKPIPALRTAVTGSRKQVEQIMKNKAEELLQEEFR